MLAGDYVEDYEIIVPFHALQMVGHTVHAVSAPEKNPASTCLLQSTILKAIKPILKSAATIFSLNATFDQVSLKIMTHLSFPAVARRNTSV